MDELFQFAKDLESKGAHYEISIGKFLQEWFNENDAIFVKTSGSTGKPKEIKICKDRMINSAKATEIGRASCRERV